MNRPLTTIFDLLDATADRHPDQIFIDGDPPISYARARDRVCGTAHRLSRALPRASATNSCVIGVFSEKSADATLLPFAITALGHIFVNINENYTGSYLEHVVRDTGMDMLLYSTEKQPVVNSVQISPPRIPIGQFVDRLDQEAVSDGEFPLIRKLANDPSTLFYTSGSTGMPKGIVIPNSSLMDGSEVVAAFLGMDETDRVLSVLPWSFDYGFNQILTSVRVGATVCLHKYLLPNRLLAEAHRLCITSLAATPHLWNSICKYGLSKPDAILPLPDLRRITNSGGAIPAPTWSFLVDWSRRDGFDVFSMYGLSEAFRSTYLDPGRVTDKQSSIGKPVPGVDIQILREDGRVCEPNEIGEIVHRGKFIANGYLNQPEANTATFRADPLAMPGTLPNRVVYSGDLGYRDEDGFLYCLGRRDQQIKIRDYRVNAAEIEAEIDAISCVVTSKVLVMREGEFQEPALRAFVVLSGANQSQQDRIAEIGQILKTKLPHYALPKSIRAVDEMPLNANFKVDIEQLRNLLNHERRRSEACC